MSWVSTYFRSAIGTKQIMALTGIGLVLFAIIHMLGHLIMFKGADAYNAYAANLQGMGALKWIARGGLLVAATLHIAAAIRTYALSRAARPSPYVRYQARRSTIASRTMRLTGMALFMFIVFHLLHFTFGAVQPEAYGNMDALNRHDAYGMFVAGFQNPILFVIYMLAIGLFSSHLAHGASSWLQTLGVRHPKYDPVIAMVGPATGIILFIGYMAPPVAVLAGYIK